MKTPQTDLQTPNLDQMTDTTENRILDDSKASNTETAAKTPADGSVALLILDQTTNTIVNQILEDEDENPVSRYEVATTFELTWLSESTNISNFMSFGANKRAAKSTRISYNARK